MPIIIAFYVAILIAYQFFVDIQGNSLYMVRYTEKTQNSSWYIIHNNNSPIETINGINEQDIARYKQKFIPTSWAKFCQADDFSKQNIINCEYLYDYTQDINLNALYGYMAWNLGNTKVFCPQSVDFFKTDNQDERNEMSEKCLVIDGKYLQPISKHFLSSK